MYFIVDQKFFIVSPHRFPINAIKKTIPITSVTRIYRALHHMSKQFVVAFVIFGYDAIQQDISFQHYCLVIVLRDKLVSHKILYHILVQVLEHRKLSYSRK